MWAQRLETGLKGAQLQEAAGRVAAGDVVVMQGDMTGVHIVYLCPSRVSPSRRCLGPVSSRQCALPSSCHSRLLRDGSPSNLIIQSNPIQSNPIQSNLISSNLI